MTRMTTGLMSVILKKAPTSLSSLSSSAAALLSTSSTSSSSSSSSSTSTSSSNNTAHHGIPYNSLEWKKCGAIDHDVEGDFRITSWNLLAPCYKRMSTRDITSGRRMRESHLQSKWLARAQNTLSFLREEIYPTSSIIALQEFWLDDKYVSIFTEDFKRQGFDLRILQRTGLKDDAVALVINNDVFEIKGSENVSLCTQGDRVALLLWLCHRKTGKNVLIANTHLSFPHNVFDRMNQMRQMQTLTEVIDRYATNNVIGLCTRIILGDFNVEAESPVCNHLREAGYFSAFETCRPDDPFIIKDAIENDKNGYRKSKNLKFVSHKTHRNEVLSLLLSPYLLVFLSISFFN